MNHIQEQHKFSQEAMEICFQSAMGKHGSYFSIICENREGKTITFHPKITIWKQPKDIVKEYPPEELSCTD